MSKLAIECSIEQLQRRRSAKWRDFGPDVLPAWIAEMDFTAAEPVQRALQELVDRQDYGYPRRDGARPDAYLARAFAERMGTAFDWDVDAQHVVPMADLSQAKAACLTAFSRSGEGVVTQTPCYPPFRDVVRDLARRFIANPLRDGDARYELDLDALAAIGNDARMLLLCNPHNPTGRAFTTDELQALGALAVRHDWIVVSDEVHADLMYAERPHRPLASLSAEIAARTVTITSAAKSFNIPGLRCCVAHFGSKDLMERFVRAVPRRLLGQPSIAGIDATVAAWRDGQPWLDQVRAQLAGGRRWLMQAVASEPGLRMHEPEATYFGWIDFGKRLPPGSAAAHLLREARVAFSPGEDFAADCAGFVRFNFATSVAVREQIWARVAAALNEQETP
ncbi:MAG: MalY/PatB family protein [Burkholderiaceae bacterium]